jgi:pimeloyl-ACP methyl ester carboxylesterase
VHWGLVSGQNLVLEFRDNHKYFMSHFTHRQPFKEPLHRDHNGLVQLGFILVSSLVLLILFIPMFARAQQPCGNIVGPETFFQVNGDYENIVTVDITDCNDPFSVTTDPSSPYTLEIDGVEVGEGDTYIQNDPIQEIIVLGTGTFNYVERFLFKHEGSDYVFFNEAVSEPSEQDYRDFASTYFETEAEVTQYMTILIEDLETGNTDQYFYDEEFNSLVDANTSEAIYDRYQNFLTAANTYLYGRVVAYEPGTYTLVIKESLLINSFWRNIREMFVKTAYAQYETGPYIYTITFTIAEPAPEPTGASSVLFLPGIQASRLYKTGVLGTEDQIWEPNRDQDVSQLTMTETGMSIEDIYTRDVIDEILLPNLGDNIYKSFLAMLTKMEGDNEIADSLAFAYDWRFSVQDIVVSGTRYPMEIKSLVTEVENLASSSFTGKVTIVGHSNGGLLAKALITELERIGKHSLVDKVIFVGVPQLGTPKAIGVLLHGFDQQKLGGSVIDDETSREVSRNMPGVYGLLPSQGYFDRSGDSVITTDDSAVTSNIKAYGNIDSLAKLSDFVLDTQDLRSNDVPINEPSTLNSGLMQSMVGTRPALDNWVAPSTIEVYEVVGTGLATVKGFEYRAYPCGTVTCVLEDGNYMKTYPVLTNEGDETVVSLSASAYDRNKVVALIDLDKEGDGVLNPDREHADLTESPAVKKFVASVIKYPYLSDEIEIPPFTTASSEYTIIGAHSPVEISLEDTDGRKVGLFNNEVLEEVDGSQFFTLGGSTYLIIPKETEYKVTVKGVADGVYSLTIDTLDANNIQSNKYSYLGAISTDKLIATFTASSSGFSTIKTDLDGDGSIDREQNLDGSEISPQVIIYTYSDLRTVIKSFALSKARERLLLLELLLAEELSKKTSHIIINRKLESIALTSLQNTLAMYNKKRYITKEQLVQATDIINNLEK